MKQNNNGSTFSLKNASPAFFNKLHVGRPNIGDKAKFLEYANQIFDSKWLSNNGPLVQELETKIAAYHEVQHCVAMCNGTIALEIAIRALALRGEVILPSYTFIATAHALHWQGITPVFADIDPATHCLDPDAVRKMISPNTTGIIGVHLWGHAAPADELRAIADEHDLKLMFDAAHAFGCSYKGRMIGNLGDAEVLSFHATKFFNTFEGGAVLTNDDELAEKIRLMRNFGFAGMDNVIYPGTNGKMIEISAAMGLVNLDNIDAVLERNRENYQAYQKGLAGLPGINLFAFDTKQRNNYQYVVMEVGNECPVGRDQIVEALHANNVLARKYFWPGCHNMQPYKALFADAGLHLKQTKIIADRVIVLPTGTSVTEHEINAVVSIIFKVVSGFL